MDNVCKAKIEDKKEKPVDQELSERRNKYWKRLSEIIWVNVKKTKESSTSSS